MAPPFAVVDFDQGTPEWLEWRQRGIGGSDAPAVMGENRYRSRAALLRDKRGPYREVPQNEAMRRGVELEPIARDAYAERIGHPVAPLCLQSTRHEWLRASVDGICSERRVVVEIKCGRATHAETVRTGRVPRHYYGQLQHILAVTGFDAIDFWCWMPGATTLHLPVARDEDYLARLLAEEARFWEEVLAP